jgi:phosphopantothenoylcysteine decarboxylase/phosphopantothenate--cysteine ligase
VRLADRRVVLGVSGGIACYKTCILARQLTELGAAVDVVMTAAATEFVRPLTFETLTKRPVLTSLWEPSRALAHIDLAKAPDAIVVAPATAHVIARAAQGLADDMLTTALLAAEAPVLLAPGMNDQMFAHPATQRNLTTLRDRGWIVVGPDIGPLAEGPSERPGRMAEPEVILAHLERLIGSPQSALRGRRVLVTAGPTREPLDAVRMLTNASSGRMGFHVAARAFARGADVTLVTGPVSLAPPSGVELARVTTTDQMQRAVAQHLPSADVLIMAAAPADFRPTNPVEGKPPKKNQVEQLSIEPTVDVLASTIDARRKGAIMVGFALEAGSGEKRARQKLEEKRLDLIVLNRADELGSGFEVDTNRVTFITANGVRPLEFLTKEEVADRILDEVERLV